MPKQLPQFDYVHTRVLNSDGGIVADIVSREKRSWIMSRIRGSGTGPEMLVRRALHNSAFDIGCTEETCRGSRT